MVGELGLRGNPFHSPDGRWVAFADNTATVVKRVPIQGGQPVTIARLPGYLRGASWGPDGEIVFGILEGGLYRVAATGGEPVRLTTPNSGGESSHVFPAFLPGPGTYLQKVLDS